MHIKIHDSIIQPHHFTWYHNLTIVPFTPPVIMTSLRGKAAQLALQDYLARTTHDYLLVLTFKEYVVKLELHELTLK